MNPPCDFNTVTTTLYDAVVDGIVDAANAAAMTGASDDLGVGR